MGQGGLPSFIWSRVVLSDLSWEQSARICHASPHSWLPISHLCGLEARQGKLHCGRRQRQMERVSWGREHYLSKRGGRRGHSPFSLCSDLETGGGVNVYQRWRSWSKNLLRPDQTRYLICPSHTVSKLRKKRKEKTACFVGCTCPDHWHSNRAKRTKLEKVTQGQKKCD